MGVFLTVEGIEGVGKSTAIQYIKNYLSEQHAIKKTIITREPGGTDIAEQIRQILLTPHAHEIMVADTELLLMFAGRAQHIAQVIKPALAAGHWVVSDRFVDASFAYQGGGRGFDMEKINLLADWIVGELKPDKTILLDAPPELGLARAKHRGPQDRIEQEKKDFFERVRAAYLSRAKEEPTRFEIIDATQLLEAVHADIKKVLDNLILGK